MKLIDPLIIEFEREAQTTRKHLERLPDDKLDWRPHEKSFTAGGLASHITELTRWADSIFNYTEFDFDPATYKPYQATSVNDLLTTFDRNVEDARQAMTGVADESMIQPWTFKLMGRVRFERPKALAFRDFTLSHVIHHRGQLSVYLRLLTVPVPGTYGPSADEPF